MYTSECKESAEELYEIFSKNMFEFEYQYADFCDLSDKEKESWYKVAEHKLNSVKFTIAVEDIKDGFQDFSEGK